jgi:hypothetical protein
MERASEWNRAVAERKYNKRIDIMEDWCNKDKEPIEVISWDDSPSSPSGGVRRGGVAYICIA